MAASRCCAPDPLSIDENTASGSTVTTFNATDDAGDTHDFTLVSGTGDTDNGAFTLTEAGVLTNNVIPDLETKSSYSIRVRATDGGGCSPRPRSSWSSTTSMKPCSPWP